MVGVLSSAIGVHLMRSLGAGRREDEQELHVIFCPGMGKGWQHSKMAYKLWLKLNIWFSTWTDFAWRGREFMEYKDSTLDRELLAGQPSLDENKIEELCDMVMDKDGRVVLFGFSAGTALCMAAALRLRSAGVVVGLLGFGHTMTVYNVWQEQGRDIPGALVFGEEEMKYVPCGEKGYFDVSHLEGFLNEDDISSRFYGHVAGTRQQCARLGAVFPNCLLLEAGECWHDLEDYANAILYNNLSALTLQRPAVRLLRPRRGSVF